MENLLGEWQPDSWNRKLCEAPQFAQKEGEEFESLHCSGNLWLCVRNSGVCTDQCCRCCSLASLKPLHKHECCRHSYLEHSASPYSLSHSAVQTEQALCLLMSTLFASEALSIPRCAATTNLNFP